MSKELRLSSKLSLAFGALVVLISAIGGLGLYQLGATNFLIGTIYVDRVVPLKQLKQVADMYAVNIVDTANKFSRDLMESAPAVAAFDEASTRQKTLWAEYTATHLTDAEKIGVANAEALFVAAQPTMDQLRRALQANDHERVAALVAPIYATVDPISGEIEKLVQLQLDVARSQYETSQSAYARAVWLFSLLMAAAVLGAVLMAWRLVRSIVGQLGGEVADATALATAIAAGDLTGQIAVAAGDDSSLVSRLAAMQDNLRQVVSNVRENSETVATASAQIAQGNEDLSQRTEQQASALQQTAATMEELGTTVRTNSESARQADRLARSASDVAVQGGDVVGKVVATMQSISDSSQQIGNIIGVIDGIAFQTNILALNAAVEAARAGEQGRGFAVVAAEVRNLAQRSAQAAREIKTLIGRSIEHVGQGTTLVDEAGETMDKVVAAIRRVSDVVAEITLAGSEQSAGIDQVGDAVNQMDQVTQQNAALVEESAAAAASLRSQAQRLVEIVAVFRLPPSLA